MIRVPDNLQYSLDLAHPAWDGWIDALPGHVDDAARRWSLTIGEAFDPGGFCSWTAPVTDADGRAAVLKVAFRHDEAMHEAEGLTALDGHGGVEVFAFEHVADNTTVMVLERCEPGTLLWAQPEAEQHVVMAGLLRRVWATDLPVDHPFRPLAAMADKWISECEETLAHEPGRIDPGLARDGLAQFRELAMPAPTDTLVFTDLHASNVLAAKREPWLIIDPKPYVGDRHYDVTQHLLNCDGFHTDPAAVIARVADLAELDRARVTQWAFARCVQETLRFGSPWPGAQDLIPRLGL